MRIGQVGEMGLIHRLRRILRLDSDRIVLGIGDDAALIRNRSGFETVLTTDALVEGIHFDLSYTPLESLGWKALAVNLSDIAAMGGTPRCAVISIAVPETWSVEDVEKLYSGLEKCGRTYHCPIVGGDTVRSPKGCFLSVTVEGDVESGKAVLRSGAKAGDLLCMTGEVGGARTGFEVLSAKEKQKLFSKTVRRFLEPVPRIQESAELIRRLPVTSMIDISDGLASEIFHLCEQSGVGCLIQENRIPLSEEAVAWAKKKNRPLSAYMYKSGEEYELLFTIPKSDGDHMEQFNRIARKLHITVIGEMIKSNCGVRVQREGKTFPLESKGWDHFRLRREQA